MASTTHVLTWEEFEQFLTLAQFLPRWQMRVSDLFA